ncbi:MAG TPA: HlyD family efflux transporter periplasmic adaptor subunit [Pirellulales bacterium]|jgi:macrolide-specific efflux system membrane fusion protein|nr:HlyD family efflux transporter periplasmic adaptor subunit [Pirellulales bacterium]
MNIGWIAAVALAAQVSTARSVPSAQPRAQVKDCLVSCIDDVQLSSEESGLIVSIDVRDGAQVQEGTLLAKINDRQAQAARQIAVAELAAAKEKAGNDINVRYARAARDVAQKELESATEANRKVPGTKSYIELEKLRLTMQQAALQIEQSQHEQLLAKYDADAGAAKLDGAEDDVLRRHIKSPLNGEVVEIMFRPGEWVQPGDKVMRLVRLDRLRIEGFVSARDFSPGELDHRPVSVEVELSRGRRERFTGQVMFVNPLVQPGGDFRIRAEVVNRQENNQWLLRPGLEADMLIDMTATAAAAPAANDPRR